MPSRRNGGVRNSLLLRKIERKDEKCPPRTREKDKEKYCTVPNPTYERKIALRNSEVSETDNFL